MVNNDKRSRRRRCSSSSEETWLTSKRLKRHAGGDDEQLVKSKQVSRPRPNARILARLIRGQVQTNGRMDREEVDRAQRKLDAIEGGVKVKLMTEYLTGNTEERIWDTGEIEAEAVPISPHD